MLHKLFQKHETFFCDMFTDEKSSQGVFLAILSDFSGIKYFFCHGIKWPKAASGINSPTLIRLLGCADMLAYNLSPYNSDGVKVITAIFKTTLHNFKQVKGGFAKLETTRTKSL